MKVNITLPAYNEAAVLERTVRQLVDFCQANLRDDWHIVIADNLSTDATPEIGKRLVQLFDTVTYCFVGSKGKGVAIKAGWQALPADVYCFMDADLATDLEALPPLLAAVTTGGHSVAIGSRSHPESVVDRTWFRRFFSFGYRLLARVLVGTQLGDLACGFKAINQTVYQRALPHAQNAAWFFDSELILVAEHLGFSVAEVPVRWRDIREAGDQSRVKTIQLSIAYTRQLLDLRRRLPRRLQQP